MKSPLSSGVQQKLQLWSGRSVGRAAQWADTVVSPREEAAADISSAEPGADSQYLTGFDSQFVDDPAALEAAPAPASPHTVRSTVPSGAPAAERSATPAPGPAEAEAEAEASAAAPAYIGSYAIQGRRPPGPLGQVYEAWDGAHARQVMVKLVQLQLEPGVKELLDPPMASALQARLDQRVLARARAALRLNHPHIATVLDAGLSPAGVYLVTERLQGRDMRDALERGWRPRPSLAALIVRRLAEALAHAHAVGLVHGDVKPANIFLDDRAHPKLLDFGIAQVAYSRGIDHGQVPLSSLQYLAPEQLMSGKADALTDIRAAGLVLHELLAMRPPFVGSTAHEVTLAVLGNQPVPPDQLRSHVPRSLVSIATRAMASEPDQRFASAADMAAALADWSDKHAARKVRMQESRRSHRPPDPTPPLRPNLASYVVALSGLAVGGLALVWMLPSDGRPWNAPQAQGTPPSLAGGPARPSAAGPVAATLAAKPDGPTDQERLLRDQAYAAKRLGLVALDVSPVAQVYVNGVLTGTTPPMTLLKLPVGNQSIMLRSEGFTPYVLTVLVRPDQPVELRHQFTP